MEHGSGSHRLGPRDLATGSDDSTSDGQAALHQKAHCDRCRMPTARYEFAKERCFCGLGVEMKRLGVELLCERPDLLFVDPVRAAQEPLPDPQVIEVEGRLLPARVEVRHDGPLLQGRCSRGGYGAKDATCRATKSRTLVAGRPRIASMSWVRRS